ncbi:hypothetical protein [Pseudomonas sp. L13]|uniref:hypothetical protein n=1 Tax=Pseudomonas sp. L13 TaxID=343985 RepID=UPI0013794A58|nr:hypothetical protein [Pseudomonas sp. L13]
MYWLVNLVNGWQRICSVIERLIKAGAPSTAGAYSVEVLRGVAERGRFAGFGGNFQRLASVVTTRHSPGFLWLLICETASGIGAGCRVCRGKLLPDGK